MDDICQEAITRALEIAEEQAIDNPQGFLFGVTRNVMREELDKKSRSMIDFIDGFVLDEHVSPGQTSEQEIDQHRDMIQVGRLVATLPAQCQRVFVLKKVYGYSHQEIATRLNISVSTVEKHAAAGMKRFMAMKKKRGSDQLVPTVSSSKSTQVVNASGELP